MPPTTPATLIRYSFEQSRIPNPPYQPGTSILIPRGREDYLAADIIDPVYSSYLPPATLHPSIIAKPTVTGQTTIGAPPPSPHILFFSTLTIAIILSVAFLSLLCSLMFIMSTRFKLRKAPSRIKHWIRKLRRGPEPKYMGEKMAYMGEAYSRYPQPKVFYLQRQETSREVPQNSPPLTREDSQTILADASAPMITGFQKRLELEEKDITLALGLALRDRSYSVSQLGVMEQDPDNSPSPEDDHRASWGALNRSRQGSDASHSTQQTLESDIFSISATTRSSLTSIREIHDDSDIEEDEMEAEDTEFEVTRAQTQSMEIKKGILMNWSVQTTSPHEDTEPLERRFPETQLTAVPSLVVTCPSTTTLSVIGPSFSSVSVDLNDFPAPPVTW